MLRVYPLTLADWGAVATKFLDKITSEFGVGAVFGSCLSCGIFWLIGRERRLRQTVDLEREKELNKQMELKNVRIDALHEELERRIRTKQK